MTVSSCVIRIARRKREVVPRPHRILIRHARLANQRRSDHIFGRIEYHRLDCMVHLASKTSASPPPPHVESEEEEECEDGEATYDPAYYCACIV